MDDDDDYWNTSETKANAFSFDDDVLSPQEILAIGQANKSYGSPVEQSLLSNLGNNDKSQLLPLSSLVSSKVLDLILQAQSGEDPSKEIKRDQEETVAVTLKRLVLGRSCSIHVHRSLASKTQLLDGAIAIGDGNAILTIVLFLVQTLNKKIVYQLLSTRALALNHYISFLRNEGKVTELWDMLTWLSRSSEAAIYQLQHHVKTQGNNVDGLLEKLTKLMESFQTKAVTDYVRLLEWQKHAAIPSLYNTSALHCLAHLCTNHWNENAISVMSPLSLLHRLQISPLQYDWVVLHVHAKSGKWDIIESLFTKKDWLGRATISTHIPTDVLICRMHQLNASKKTLANFVNKVTDVDERLRLALTYKIHSIVIETYTKQKDRIALTNYKVTLSPQSEEYILAENTLRDNSIKWKN